MQSKQKNSNYTTSKVEKFAFNVENLVENVDKKI